MLNDIQVERIIDHVRSMVPHMRPDMCEQQIREYELHGADGTNLTGIVGKYIAQCVDRIRDGKDL